MTSFMFWSFIENYRACYHSHDNILFMNVLRRVMVHRGLKAENAALKQKVP